MQNALIPSKNALVSVDLLSHPDSDVRVSVVSCLTEILRITAPEAPYSDDQMKEIFRLTIEAFEKLADASSRSYGKAKSVLDSVSKVRSCLVMLDLECDDLILQMFRMFLNIIRSDHPQVVFSSMEMIMITILDETEEVSKDLLDTLLSSVKKQNQNVSPTSRSLVEKVLSRCARKLKPYIIEALKSTGTNLDMYYPVVASICQSVFETTTVRNIVNTKENEAAETKLGRQVAPSDSLKDKLGLGHSRKEIRCRSSSKRPVRDETRRINVNRKLSNGNNSFYLKQSLKQGTDAETDIGITGKRGRKPNSLMNPEEGYDISWISGKRDPLKTSSYKKLHKKGYGGESSLGKVAAKKTPLAKETSPSTSRALSGSVKRSRVKMDESDHDLDSFSSPRLKKLASCFRDEEPLKKESNQESYETPEEDRKIGNSSKKTRSQNGVEKSQGTAKKKPIIEPKIVNSSGKRSSARSDAKKKTLEAASSDTPVPQSSRDKKKVSQESDKNGFGEDLVGKRVNIWWPLDKTFYEGVIESYCSRKKTHRVVYSDGDSEELNLIKERWELLEDLTSASEDMEIDLPESIPLFDIMQREKVKKSINVAVSVEPTSSSARRSSSRTVGKIDSGKKINKQVKRGKGGSKAAVVSEKTREGKNLKSLKELNAQTDRAEEQEVSRDVDHESEDDYYSEKQEQSENKSDEILKLADTEAETKEEEKQYPNSEVESEREGSESEEEPKWRETEDMEDEAEEREEAVDVKGTSTSLSEIEKEEDEERDS
ncbi:hypothetical protein EUTSA_v10018162mg [Eutrema salsugineum]|uniref:Tudor domain-containing protein n=1 Tax=Eutrema salsugineum TaxID=72664 RepID=V4M7M5_EUTSA|nr:hypothetical protein EUTSA_v10018162mg [Eutrema salsugineum]